MTSIEAQKIFNRIQLCGCGTSSWDMILFLLEKAEDHDKNGSFYDPKDHEQRWIEFGAKVIDFWGLTEHGCGIGWAWLTDDGKWLLEWLRKNGTDDNTWPEGYDHGEGCPCGCSTFLEDHLKRQIQPSTGGSLAENGNNL